MYTTQHNPPPQDFWRPNESVPLFSVQASFQQAGRRIDLAVALAGVDNGDNVSDEWDENEGCFALGPLPRKARQISGADLDVEGVVNPRPVVQVDDGSEDEELGAIARAILGSDSRLQPYQILGVELRVVVESAPLVALHENGGALHPLRLVPAGHRVQLEEVGELAAGGHASNELNLRLLWLPGLLEDAGFALQPAAVSDPKPLLRKVGEGLDANLPPKAVGARDHAHLYPLGRLRIARARHPPAAGLPPAPALAKPSRERGRSWVLDGPAGSVRAPHPFPSSRKSTRVAPLLVRPP